MPYRQKHQKGLLENVQKCSLKIRFPPVLKVKIALTVQITLLFSRQLPLSIGSRQLKMLHQLGEVVLLYSFVIAICFSVLLLLPGCQNLSSRSYHCFSTCLLINWPHVGDWLKILLGPVRVSADKKNKHQSIIWVRFPKCRNSSTIREYMKIQDDNCITITVHTWTVVFLKHLANTSFMASCRALTEPHSSLTLWACIMLPRIQFIATVQVSPQCLLLSGWLLTNVQVNITTTLHDTWHTCIYITLVLLFVLLSTHLQFS
jgi:hypothetical protein